MRNLNSMEIISTKRSVAIRENAKTTYMFPKNSLNVSINNEGITLYGVDVYGRQSFEGASVLFGSITVNGTQVTSANALSLLDEALFMGNEQTVVQDGK